MLAAMAAAPSPGAFFSYVRFNDERDDGRLAQLCDDLSREVRAQTGDDFPLWRDRNDIRWGEQWEARIELGLDQAIFLICVITPSWFKSPYCRKEFEHFLEVEKKRSRHDLILPVLYIDTPGLRDEKLRAADPIAIEMSKRQIFRFDDLRFEPWTSADVGKRLAQMACAVRDALLRDAPPAPSAPAPKPRPAAAMEFEPASVAKTSVAEGAPARVKTCVVDLFPGRGNYTSIAKAIENAAPAERILVHPGLYREALVLDKTLEIVGDSPVEEIVIETSGKDCLLFKAGFSRVVNLTFRQTGGGDFYAIDITQGRLDLEDCDISSQSNAGVGIHGSADPRLRRNRIHDGKQCGVLLYDNGKGTLEDNDIFANARVGVQIQTGADPLLQRNRIHDGKQGGVLVAENGKGTLEDNDIFANAFTGVEIREGGRPVLRGNRISKNKYEAVWVREAGGGTFEGNDLRENEKGAWDIHPSSASQVVRKDNKE